MPDATINLADPQGVWRPVYAHRTALHATADAIIIAAWRRDIQGINLRPAVAAWQHTIGEAVTPAQQHRRQAAAASILALLTRRAWRRLRASIALAVKRAYAAGWAAAHALLTQDAGDDSTYDTGPVDGYTLAPSTMSDATATATAIAILTAALRAIARRAGLAMAGNASNPQQAAEQALADGYDIGLAADKAVSAAYGAGQLASYVSNGVQSVSWVTAADANVCERCSDYEANGPYSPFAAPMLPAHELCRCALVNS